MTNVTEQLPDAAAVQRLLDEEAIRKIVYRYCRGVDRRDFDLVRSCYHPDATDDHGPFDGSVDEFIEWCKGLLDDFESTMHFIGNVLVDIDDNDPNLAYSEAYAVAYHRIPEHRGRPPRDYITAARYVDRFERRDGVWAIAVRRCVVDWSRMDTLGSYPASGPGTTYGVAGPEDVVFSRF